MCDVEAGHFFDASVKGATNDFDRHILAW